MPGAKGSSGGKRPGAGAPRGNLNALTHGKQSNQMHQLIEIIAAAPGGKQLLANILARHQAQIDRGKKGQVLKERRDPPKATYPGSPFITPDSPPFEPPCRWCRHSDGCTREFFYALESGILVCDQGEGERP